VIDVVGLAREVLREAGLGFRDVSVIELDRSGAEAPGLALLAFVDGKPEPQALIKASADPRRGERLRSEFDNLRRLHAEGTDAVRRGVPAPLHLGQHGDLVTLAETAVAGTRMKNFPPDRYFNSRRFSLHLEALLDWLAEFHTAISTPGQGDDAASAVGRYRAAFDVSPALDALLTESAERLDAADSRRFAWHGDFCTANIIVGADERITVVDWEYPI